MRSPVLNAKSGTEERCADATGRRTEAREEEERGGPSFAFFRKFAMGAIVPVRSSAFCAVCGTELAVRFSAFLSWRMVCLSVCLSV
eukprot:1703540-Rhodomonas_salina.1